MRKLLVSLTLALAIAGPALAQDSAELAKNNPVAIVAQAQGSCEIKKPGGDWQPAFWLTLLQPEDQLRSNDKSKLVIDFFSDEHKEIMESSSETKVAFRNLAPVSGPKVRREQARDRSATELAIPYSLLRKLYKKDFELADEPGAKEKEIVFLTGAVRPEAFPPVFDWKNIGSPSYRLQLFNEWDEVIWETKTKEAHLRYPFNAPFKLAKNSQYRWQVLAADDTIVVRKYAFTLLTLPHSQELERRERQFDQLVSAKKATPADYTDLFLHYNNRKLVDRSLKILKKMANLDPNNPVVQRALVRAYLDKGCPAHAREALEREGQLNGSDPVAD
jgi:hypothetical protein